MYSKKLNSRSNRREDGVAIIIVLSFVVLLSGLVVAFLARSLSEQQVSASSVNQARADALAQAALNIIIGDLKQEIADGSTATPAAAGSGTIYLPTTGTMMLPQRDATLHSGTLHNLVRVSRTGTATAPAVASRASAVSSVTPSLNLRRVTADRWNSHYLLPLESGSTTATFTPPQWVYVTGSGPTVVTSGTDDVGKSVIGRYAFAIYDEGGLLDINVAGHPSDGAGAYAPKKASSAYADLTVLTGTLPLSVQDVDNLVGWRNRVSALATGTFGSDYSFITGMSGSNYYHNYITTSTTGMMRLVVGADGGGVGGNDQSFTSRQALIRYWKNPTIGLPLDLLQYFGTHSRDWNFASYTPPAGRPMTSGTARNLANGDDNAINPSFAKFLVATEFTRLDNTVAKVGEPLVKRFPLSRIGTLQTGTNRAFGLVRQSNGTCTYEDAENATNVIKRLDQIVNREPNFFELLKAAITAGAVTRAGATSGEPFASISDDDKKIDYAIIQIGANIIDQYDENQYPTAITFDGKTFRGVEDLPYLYRVRQTVVKTTKPEPAAPSDGAAVSGTDLTITGAAVAVIQPEVWNPHLSVVSSTGARPSTFSFSIKSRAGTTLNDVVAESKDGGSSAGVEGDDLPGFVNPGAALARLFGTQILFSDNSGALFREPVVLNQFNQPVGSNATAISTGSAGGSFSLPTTTGTGTYFGIYVGAAPLRWIKSGSDPEVLSASKVSVIGNDEGLIYQLAYQDGANWVVYDEKVGPAIGAVGEQDISFDPVDDKGFTTEIQTWSFAVDPRTGRFGMMGGYQPTYVAPPVGNATGNTTGTSAKGVPTTNGWTVGASFEGDLIAVNQNGSTTRYEDADGKVRRAMGSAQSPLAGSSTNRPVILNRPFRSLGDLAHVFSGLPWRNLDLSFPESGYAALLDVFSINEVKSENGLVAGKVNLNTRQSEVLKAILAGAELDGVVAVPGGTVDASTTGSALAAAIRTRTSGAAQLKNLREIVGDYNGSDYDGLAPIIADELGTNVIRNWSAVVGTLANAGQTRVWNLFIDIIAQPGRFGNNPGIDKFMVEGEQRYWVHLAIDRYTGKVIDRSIEIVKE